MDPTIVALVAAASTALGSLVTLGAETFAKQAGTAAFEATKRLLARLRQRWSADPQKASQLARFEAAPAAERDAFERALATELALHAELLAELAAWQEVAGPELHVVQRLGAVERATGVAADAMTEGRLTVEQSVAQGAEVTGVSVKRIGR